METTSNVSSPTQKKTPGDKSTATVVIHSIRDFELAGKRVLMRLDLNVPLSEPDANGVRTVEDDSRVVEALPTIRYAIEKGAKVIIASHLGRPDGKPNSKYSLEPVAALLAEKLGQEVTLADDCVGEGIELMAAGLKGGQVLLLENLRFHEGEEANDPEFTHQLARIGEIYINDAFGTAHRKHASTYGVPALNPNRGMGLLIEKELQFLGKLIDTPAKPFFTILGGAKVSDKIKTIESLMKRVDGFLIGGAMAHAFWRAEGTPVPADARQPSSQDVEAARHILKTAAAKGVLVQVPIDTNGGFDIGPKTVERFVNLLSKAQTVFWNGPLGWFEREEYAVGTREVAKALGGMTCLKVVGGGDTVSAIKHAGFGDQFDHLSTGGGAVLEFIEKEGLPGIEILRTNLKQVRRQEHLH